MSYITKITGSNGTTYDIKDAHARDYGMLYYIEPTGTAGNSTTKVSAKWQVSNIAGSITTPYNGMRVAVKIPVAGLSTYGVVMSIDGGTSWHPVVYNLNTVFTTQYAVNTIKIFIYDATATQTGYPVAGGGTQTITGVWKGESNYDTNSNTIGHQLRTNSSVYKADSVIYRYQLLCSIDEMTLSPFNNVSNNANTAKTLLTNLEFDPFGKFYYYGTTTTVAAAANIGATVIWEQNVMDLRYSFNIGNTLVNAKDVFLRCIPQSNGKVKIDNRTQDIPNNTGPIAQELPTTDDGYVYIYLGHTYTNSNNNIVCIELCMHHPIYYFKDGALRLWTNDAPADVIVTMDLTESSSSGSTAEYTVSNASHTPTQVVSLISSGKNVKIAANKGGETFNLDYTHSDSNGLVFSCATVTLALMMYLVVGDTTNDSWAGLSGGLAEYGHHHGYISSTGTLTDTPSTIVNGDAIIVRGSGGNIVTTSDTTFDGSTTNQVLSKKGTWVTLPTNTDILVKQTSDTTSTSEFPLLASAQSSPTSGTAYEAKYNANIKIKPSNGTLTATNLVGDGMNIGGIVSFCSCTTAAATAAKELTVNGTNGSSWTLSVGKIIALSSCTYSNTATNVTFNVNNTGAYSIYYDNAVYSGSSPFITGHEDGRTTYYMFDGTYWVWMGRVQGGVEIQYDATTAKCPVAFVPFAVTSTSTGFNSLRFNGDIYANPGNGYLYATRFVGSLDGASSRNAVAIANNDALLIADASQSNRITPSTTKFGTSTTTFLRNDGQWATPSGGGGDTGYASSALSNNTSTITFGNTKEYQRVVVTGSTQTFNLSVGNNCTNYLLVTNSGSNDCVVAIGVQSGTSITTIAKPSGGITVPSGKTIELSFIKIASASVMGEYTLVVTASEEMSIVSV